MREKVLDIKTEKEVKELKQMLEAEMLEAQKKYTEQWADWKIKSNWEKNTLHIDCAAFNVKGQIEITTGRIVAYLDIPFYFLPFKGKYIDMIKPLVMKALREKKVITGRMKAK